MLQQSTTQHAVPLFDSRRQCYVTDFCQLFQNFEKKIEWLTSGSYLVQRALQVLTFVTNGALHTWFPTLWKVIVCNTGVRTKSYAAIITSRGWVQQPFLWFCCYWKGYVAIQFWWYSTSPAAGAYIASVCWWMSQPKPAFLSNKWFLVFAKRITEWYQFSLSKNEHYYHRVGAANTCQCVGK